jgi:hypothetical protein
MWNLKVYYLLQKSLPCVHMVKNTNHKSSNYAFFFPCKFHLHPNIFLSTLQPNTLKLSSLRDRKFAHPYKTTGKIIFLYAVALISLRK